MTKKNQTLKTEVPSGFKKMEVPSGFLKLEEGDQIVAEFLGFQTTDGGDFGPSECWRIKYNEDILLLPEKTTMRNFRSELVPGKKFFLANDGTAPGKNYYNFTFGVEG